jgi:hypothetical protein
VVLKEAFRRGVQLAAEEAGLTKDAADWPAVRKVLFHPATLGAAAGTGGELLAGHDVGHALRTGALGAGIGAGVRYLPKVLPKVKALTTSQGQLAPGIADISWIAPSFLLAPALTGGGEKPGHTRVRGKR